MKVLFGTVIYDLAMEYFDSFLYSLKTQTYLDYELLIINDNVMRELVDARLGNVGMQAKVYDIERHYSPAFLRTLLIKEAKKAGADLLIIGDADDYFSNNRIEATVKKYADNRDYGFFYNDLKTMDGNSVMPTIPDFTEKIEDILDYNYIGLSNSAICLTNIDYDFIKSLEEYQEPIFDWYLYSRLLLKGIKGIRVPKTQTIYRFHNNNTVGFQQKNEESIKNERAVKVAHYKALSSFSSLIQKRYLDYQQGNYRIIEKKEYYWWNYTVGGTYNEV